MDKLLIGGFKQCDLQIFLMKKNVEDQLTPEFVKEFIEFLCMLHEVKTNGKLVEDKENSILTRKKPNDDNSLIPNTEVPDFDIKRNPLKNVTSISESVKDSVDALLHNGEETSNVHKHSLHNNFIQLANSTVIHAGHNDRSFYPNIHCIICNELVCSRNRILHMESHLCYRPYTCSECSISHRREIFIRHHIRIEHSGIGNVLKKEDKEIIEQVKMLADDCIVYTKVLEECLRNGTQPPQFPLRIHSKYMKTLRVKVGGSRKNTKRKNSTEENSGIC